MSTVWIADIAVIGDVPLDTEHLLGDGLVSWLGVCCRVMGIGCFIFICWWKGYFFVIFAAG